MLVKQVGNCLRAAICSIEAILVLIAIVLQPVLMAVPVDRPVPSLHNPLVFRPASTTVPGQPPFAPSDLWKAYNFLPVFGRGYQGNGTRIAIIDAYGDPSLPSDLSTFDSLTGLPSATVNYYYPDGFPKRSDSNWAVEVALDVEWAHAIAPQATIDLIIAVDNSLLHLYDTVQYMANNLPEEATLSMSWGDWETNYPTTGPYTIATMHQLFFNISSHGTTIFASSGDGGSLGCCAIQYPASDPLVVGVGGTSLSLNSNASYAIEQAWSGSTAGNSIVFGKPSWQQGLGDELTRDSVDVSYDADPNTGVLVIQGGTRFAVGGTSAGSPQWAGLIALAAQAEGRGLGGINPRLYKLSTYHDVVHGFNGYYYATSGWDYPTGLGTPDAYSTLAALVPPVPVVANELETMQGVTVATTTALNVSQFTGLLSGRASVNAKNSTTGASLFSRNYNITSVQLQSRGSTYFGSFILNIPLTTHPLSSNVRVSEQAGNVTTTLALTRRLDMNGDGVVNILDLSYVASVYGITANSSTYNPNADVDANGMIDIVDLAYVAAFFNSPDYL